MALINSSGSMYMLMEGCCRHASLNITMPLKWYLSRSIAGYVPCDFAFVVSKNRNLVKILDSDQHLLPRAGCPQLEKCIIEVL